VEKPWECIKGKYVNCPIYKRAPNVNWEEKDEKVKVRLTKTEEGEDLVIIKAEDDAQYSNCLDCVFYSIVTGRCVKLKVKVRDPSNPPCGGKYFKNKGK
jgi:hypothetical protein